MVGSVAPQANPPLAFFSLIILIDFNDYCSSARINIAFIKNHSIQNELVPPKLLSTCSL